MSKNSFYMDIANLVSTRSKDNKTKVGACIVKDKKVLSLGYNGAPRNFPDDIIPHSSDTSLPLDKQKNSYMIHAEVNAILNYSGSLNDLKGSTIFVTVSPCFECAKVIAQAGIKEVYYGEEYHRKEYWDMAKLIFNMCGIKYQKFTGENND